MPVSMTACCLVVQTSCQPSFSYYVKIICHHSTQDDRRCGVSVDEDAILSLVVDACKSSPKTISSFFTEILSRLKYKMSALTA